MTDDYLADFERELHAAATRRATRSRAPRRLLAPAMAMATAAAVAVVLTLAGPGEREVEVPPAGSPPAGATVELPLLALTDSACAEARERTVDAVGVPARMGVFRRPQTATEAATVDLLRDLPAADFDGRATRSPAGIGVRVLLSPTSDASRCGRAHTHPQPGVCMIFGQKSRCFSLEAIEAGNAVAVAAPGVVVGMVTDAVDAVVVEVGGKRVQATVAENAFHAELPGADEGTPARVTLRAGEVDGCAPTAAMRRAVPVLDREAPGFDVPQSVRSTFGADSPVIGRHARPWAGVDGVTFWIVPHLHCDGAREDEVCVALVFDEDLDSIGGGGSACTPIDELGRGGILFPLRDDRGAAAAGFAPPGAAEAFVRIREAGIEQRFPVKDGVWGGVLDDYRLPRGRGDLVVEFDVPYEAAPKVAVLNGTTTTGLGKRTMDALRSVNYRSAENDVGDWSEHDIERTVVYEAPGQRGLGDRIAIYLGERFDVPKPEVREMTDTARVLGGEDADAVVVTGRDLAG